MKGTNRDHRRDHRDINRSVQAGFDRLYKIAKEENTEVEANESNSTFHFLCECSSSGCRQRIIMTLDEYNRTHLRGEVFIVIPGHQMERIETVIEEKPNYLLVRKKLDTD